MLTRPRCTNALRLNSTLGDLPEGTTNLTARATDAGGTTGSRTYGVKIDRTPPQVSVDGIDEGDKLPGNTLDVTLAGTDAGAAGVAKIDVDVDGHPDASYASDSGDALTRTWTFDATTDGYGDGAHTIIVAATDRAGNSTRTTLHVTVREQAVRGPQEISSPGYSDPADSPASTPNPGLCVPDLTNSASGTFCNSESVPNESDEPAPTGALAAAAAGSGTSTNPPPVPIGLADQNFPAVLKQPMFRELRSITDPADSTKRALRRLRVFVEWDMVTRSSGAQSYGGKVYGQYLANKLDNFDAYLRRAKDYGMQVLVSFTAPSDAQDYLPTVDEYNRATAAFFLRYESGDPASPFAAPRYFTSWNEVNYGTQPTRSNPSRAGQFHRSLDMRCQSLPAGRRCNVYAGSFLDDTRTLTADFIDKYAIAAGQPKRWAIHAYSASNQERTDGTAGSPNRINNFASRLPDHSRIWITETGGLRTLRLRPDQTHSQYRRGVYGADCPAFAVRYLLWDLPRQFNASSSNASHDRKISRIYVYQYRGDSNFDSGLLPYGRIPTRQPSEGDSRPYYEFKAALQGDSEPGLSGNCTSGSVIDDDRPLGDPTVG